MRLTASAIVLCLASVTVHAAPTACFTPDEAKAAQFRTLQQEFNVAALNCRSIDPNDPSIADRYNVFVGKFGGKMQDNAQALRHHFTRAGGNFDAWMTRVANDAGQRAVTDPDYCQRASDDLDKALQGNADAIDAVAATNSSVRMGVPMCGEARTAKASTGHAKSHKKPKKPASQPAPAKPSADKPASS